MKRIAETYISQWYSSKNRKPLVMRGARQVGKTTLVRLCAKQLNLNLIEINLEKPYRFTQALATMDVKNIVEFIELELNIDINPETSLIFFDEVQVVPEIIHLLRYFYEELPQYAIITTGSLLEFVLDEPHFSMPVGRVSFMYLGVMTFEEFLLALDEKKLLTFIQQFDLTVNIPDIIHSRCLALVKTYCITGGMPESVKSYAEHRSYKPLNVLKSDVVTAFELDFGKYHKKVNATLLTKVFYQLPQQLGFKIKYTNLDQEARSQVLNEILNQLNLAKIIYKVHHSNANGIPLKAEMNARSFKVLFLDVGLVQTILGINPLDITLIEDINAINQGAIAEQFIGQHLLYLNEPFQPPELYYWMREKRNAAAELDYVITLSNHVIPVEVKSGKTGRLKSLQLFVQEKQIPLALRFNADKASCLTEARKTIQGEVEFKLLSLPHYLVGQTKRILSDLIL